MSDRSRVEPTDAREGRDAAGRRARLDLEDGVAPEDKTDATRALSSTPFARGPARPSPCGSTASGRRGGGTTSRLWRTRGRTSSSSRRSSRPTRGRGGGALPPGTGLEAQIETARGLVEVERIAAAGHGLEALVFGPGDFGASIGVPVLTIGEGSWDYALARIVVAARAFGLQAVDGPYAAIRDLDGLRASARNARSRTGYDGKWVVHPDQIAPVNEVFSPAEEELERARRILAAGEGRRRWSTARWWTRRRTGWLPRSSRGRAAP